MNEAAGRTSSWLGVAGDVKMYLGSVQDAGGTDLGAKDVVYLRMGNGTTCLAGGYAGQKTEPTPVPCNIGVLLNAETGVGIQTVEGVY